MHTANIRRFGGDTGGYALFIVLVTLLTLSVLIGVMSAAATQQAFMTRKLVQRTRAQLVAETGVINTYKLLTTDFDRYATSTVPICADYGGGTYSGKVTRIDSNTVTITSRGIVGGVRMDVKADVVRFKPGSDIFPGWDPDPFDTMIVAGKEAQWKAKKKMAGELAVSVVSVHANKRLKVEGEEAVIDTTRMTSSKRIELRKSATVSGLLRAPQIVIDGSVIYLGVPQIAPVPTLKIPMLDLTPYYAAAVRNGQVINGDLKIARGQTVSIAPPGGILWVNGKVEIDGNGTINGSIFATKDIKISGAVTQTRYGSYPALVSRDKKVKIEGSGTYEGLIYAPKGDVQVKKKGTGSITGSIIAGKNFRGEGAWSFMNFVNTTPVYPDGSRADPPSSIVYIAAWQR